MMTKAVLVCSRNNYYKLTQQHQSATTIEQTQW